MLIYIFTEFYPSPYKPYFDTQFEQFIKDGHKLKIYSAAEQGDQLEAKVIDLNLCQMISHFPATLRAIPMYIPRVIKNVISNPISRSKAIFLCMKDTCAIKRRFMNAMRMLVLPLEKPDLCLVHNLVTAIQFPFLRDLYRNSPVAFYYHGGEVAGVPQIKLDDARKAFSTVDYVFTNSANSKNHAINRGCRSDKINICPVGFNLEEFSIEGDKSYKKDGVLQLLTIGRMSEEKGHIYAIKAIKKLVDDGLTNIHYKLIGGGPLLSDLREYVSEQCLNDYITFLGYLPRDELNMHLKDADAHILPSIVLGSWQENQACVVQEAMLFNLMVINSTAGGVPESTSPSMQQFNIEPGNVSVISEKIKKLLDMENDQMIKIANAGRQFVIDNYDIRKLNNKLISISTGQIR